MSEDSRESLCQYLCSRRNPEEVCLREAAKREAKRMEEAKRAAAARQRMKDARKEYEALHQEYEATLQRWVNAAMPNEGCKQNSKNIAEWSSSCD